MDKISSLLLSLTEEEKERVISMLQPPKRIRSSSSQASPFVERIPSPMAINASSSSSSSMSPSHFQSLPRSPNQERKDEILNQVDPSQFPDFKALVKSHEVKIGRLIKDKVQSLRLLRKLKEDYLDKGNVPKSLQQHFKVSLPATTISNTLKRELTELDAAYQTACLNVLYKAREQEGKDLVEGIRLATDAVFIDCISLLEKAQTAPTMISKIRQDLQTHLTGFIRHAESMDKLERAAKEILEDKKQEINDRTNQIMADQPVQASLKRLVEEQLKPIVKDIQKLQSRNNKSSPPSSSKESKTGTPSQGTPKTKKKQQNKQKNSNNEKKLPHPSANPTNSKSKNFSGRSSKWKDKRKKDGFKGGQK